MDPFLLGVRQLEWERKLRGQKLSRAERRHLKETMGVYPEVHTMPFGAEHSFYLPPIDVRSHDRQTRRELYNVIKAVYGPAAPLGPSLHDWSKGSIRTSDYAHPGVLAHELGHAQFYENPLGRMVSEISHPADSAAKWAIPAAFLGRKAAKVAPFAAAAAVTPKLLSEYEATRRGIQGMIDAGYSDEMVDEAGGLFGLQGSFGTYAQPAALTVGGAAAAGQIANWLRRLR